MIGERISDLVSLHAASSNKRSVVVPKSWFWEKPKPAAVLIHESGAVLLLLFDLGMFIYEKDGPVVDAEFKPKKNKEVG